MLLTIYPKNPDPLQIKKVVECMRDGGVVIYPTDTVYGIGCDINKLRAIERIAKIKNINPEKANFSIICSDLSHLSNYAKPLDNKLYRVMRKALPGPFTFILQASGNVPKIFKAKKTTIGIRIPDNNIPLEIVKMLDNPIVNTSVHAADEIIDYTTDPQEIYEQFKHQVDIVIDGGFGGNQPSTVVNCSEGDFEIIREGAGELAQYL